MVHDTLCYIGIGSNLGDSVANVQSALKQLSIHNQLKLLSHSRLYSSKPHGPQNQPDYVNAVAAITTELTGIDLLHALFYIENNHGRERLPNQRWGPRTLDLDLLLYGNDVINEPDLKVPHPHMQERSFVTFPLAELNPELILPDGTHLQDCKSKLAGDDLFVLDSPD
uniref:2-amino-4-hydroxy-6-hydroxymethyldihydropteridine pyrophosphokinase n=1 Tax=uncultured Thiotrichaceae bacterium TaxID=298394 RepID=A0A6S6TWU0_9GAMM|nr:MAG: 2-amino-4-hydroxy-6-hydroxymethyldihydropteridinepyrophosphokinase (EC [uncultured Thiotrichaceae bacterium]